MPGADCFFGSGDSLAQKASGAFLFQARAMIALVTPQVRGCIIGNKGNGRTVLGLKKTPWVETGKS
jgi:hypothetical protein